MPRLLIDYVHELGAKIGLSEEETERIWFDECGGDFEALTNAIAVKCCAIIFADQLQKCTRDPQMVKEAVNYAIKEERRVMKWTPTKESPPKKEGFYLVQRKYQSLPFILWFGIDPRYPRGNNNCVQRFWCDECEDVPVPLDMEDALAWMPLPKPYKEGKS